MDKNAKQTAISVAIITGIFGCVAAIIGWGQPFAEKVADTYFSTSVPSPTSAPLLPEVAFSISQPIVYTTENNDITVVNEDGSSTQTLTRGAFVDDYPDWSPDGKYIAFHSSRSGNNEIYIMPSYGEDLINVTNNDADDVNPSWSADGMKLVFVSNRNGNYDLYILNLITNEIKQLTNTSNQVELYPDCSPDGQHISLSIRENDTQAAVHLFTMNIDGSNLKQITYDNTVDITSAWSPDGKQLVFSSSERADSTAGESSIYSVGRDGTGLMRLTWENIQAVDPAWSPDGTKIIFWGTAAGMTHSDLFIMNTAGYVLANVTNTPDLSEFGPAWVSR